MYGYVQIPMCFTDEEDYRGNMIIEVILYQDKSRQDHKEWSSSDMACKLQM